MYTPLSHSQKKVRNLLGLFVLGAVALTPQISFAACGTVTNLEAAITVPFCFITTLMPMLVGVEIALFIYGIIRYLMATQSDADRQTGRKFALFGIIAVAVTVGVWGLIMVVRNTAGITGTTNSVQPLQFSEEPQNL